MDINWYGHSCFRLRGRESSVVTDPYAPSAGYGSLRAAATVVTVSNEHPHHSHVQAVSEARKVLRGPGEYEIGGLMITGMATSRDPQASDQIRNTAYLIEIDDITVCHLGDLSRTLTTDEIEVFKEVHVLLLPVGGHCTIGAAQAAEVVSQIEPKMIIPMHYAAGASKVPLDPVDPFCREMGVESLPPQPRISITRTGLPEEPTVVLLEGRRP